MGVRASLEGEHLSGCARVVGPGLATGTDGCASVGESEDPWVGGRFW